MKSVILCATDFKSDQHFRGLLEYLGVPVDAEEITIKVNSVEFGKFES